MWGKIRWRKDRHPCTQRTNCGWKLVGSTETERGGDWRLLIPRELRGSLRPFHTLHAQQVENKACTPYSLPTLSLFYPPCLISLCGLMISVVEVEQDTGVLVILVAPISWIFKTGVYSAIPDFLYLGCYILYNPN